MNRLSDLIGILVPVAILGPYPTWEHFIWPLSNCVLADICNHTWIPECAFNNDTAHRRLFTDECDIWEYNCDHSKNYQIVNYSICFQYQESPCRTNSVLRKGDYKYVLEGRKVVYAPISSHTHPETVFFLPATTRPNLPSIMFHGQRRHTPEAKKINLKRRSITVNKLTTKERTNIKKIALKRSTQRTMVLKKITVVKNGKIMFKVFKGIAPEVTSQDSDFMQ